MVFFSIIIICFIICFFFFLSVCFFLVLLMQVLRTSEAQSSFSPTKSVLPPSPSERTKTYTYTSTSYSPSSVVDLRSSSVRSIFYRVTFFVFLFHHNRYCHSPKSFWKLCGRSVGRAFVFFFLLSILFIYFLIFCIILTLFADNFRHNYCQTWRKGTSRNQISSSGPARPSFDYHIYILFSFFLPFFPFQL